MTNILSKLNKIRIGIIGDLMLDRYIFGKVDRISPEAPVPIVKVTKETEVLGGAANVAANISTLNGKAHLFGIVGNDEAKNKLIERCKFRNINTSGLITDATKKTIQKIRIIGEHQQMVRVDYEDTAYINNTVEDKLIDCLFAAGGFDAIIISDYAKGTITERLFTSVRDYCLNNNIKLIVDPKPSLHKFYNNAFLITPNKKEAQEMSGVIIKTLDDVIIAGKKIIDEYNSNLVITLGDMGMMVFEKGNQPVHIPTEAKEVFDVSGAGDTVIATLALCIAAGLSLVEAAKIANIAAGIKVGKLGTAPVEYDELFKSLIS